MALLFLDGFDKYGPANSNSTAVAALLTAGEWTAAPGGTHNIVAPLSSTGQAWQVAPASSSTPAASKTLAASYARLIGGVRFNSNLASANAGITFLDSGTVQCTITFNTTGTISLRTGNAAGTAVGTSTASVSANTTHYLEWDITFGNTGAYQIWLDGVSILSGTGDSTSTANNTANGFGVIGSASQTMIFDDLYLFDTTGTTNNAVLLTSPRIETQVPTGDGAVQFSVGAGVVGNSVQRQSASQNITTNQLLLKSVIPIASCTLNSITLVAGATANATINQRPVVYASSSGAPGTLLGSGTSVVGTTANTAKTLPLSSGVALTAGTQYWIGILSDVSVVNGMAQTSATADDRFATATYASGPPATAPAMSASAMAHLWGNVTPAANFGAISQNPTQGSLSYVYEATVGEEDLYTYPALSAPPSAIYAVAVKASVAKSDAGAKTVSVRLKSGATDSAGTGGTQAPGTSYAWLTSNYPTDPATSAAWTLSALNAAQAGVKVES